MPRTREELSQEGGPGLQLCQEELQASKRPVEGGEVEIRKNLVAEQQTLEVPKTREDVAIDPRPVTRRPADRPIGEDETIGVPVYEEKVEVEKQPVAYEELEVGNRQVQETEGVSDTVRQEQLPAEREGDVNLRGDEPCERR